MQFNITHIARPVAAARLDELPQFSFLLRRELFQLLENRHGERANHDVGLALVGVDERRYDECGTRGGGVACRPTDGQHLAAAVFHLDRSPSARSASRARGEVVAARRKGGLATWSTSLSSGNAVIGRKLLQIWRRKQGFGQLQRFPKRAMSTTSRGRLYVLLPLLVLGLDLLIAPKVSGHGEKPQPLNA